MPRTMPSSAAATVPEYVMSSPRLEPWLMPETISSGWNAIRPSVANLTQSTGVTSVAKPDVPSPMSTSSTQSGLRVVMLRAIALRFESGAITASSRPGTYSRACRMVRSPIAWMPSSFVRRTFTNSHEDSRGRAGGSDAGVVSHGLQVQAAGRRCLPRLASRPPLQESRKPVHFHSPRRHVQHGARQRAHHPPHEAVGLDPERDYVRSLVEPLRAGDAALEAVVVGLRRREGGEVVGPGQKLRTGVE